MSQNKFDAAFMDTARIWAKQSYCKRKQVGATIVRDDTPVLTRFNGTISGQDNICEDEVLCCADCKTPHILDRDKIDTSNLLVYSFRCKTCGVKNSYDSAIDDFIELRTNDFTLHAEFNAITFASKHGIPLDGCSMFVTLSPCKECSKLIASSGITRVVYDEEYKDLSGIEYLGNLGITVEKIKKSSKV